MDKGQHLLNKIFRAVHDNVCPRCGRDMERLGPGMGVYALCGTCGFTVTNKEMQEMSSVIELWGKEAVAYFEEWRKTV